MSYGIIQAGRRDLEIAENLMRQAVQREYQRNQLNEQIKQKEEAERQQMMGTFGGLGLRYGMSESGQEAFGSMFGSSPVTQNGATLAGNTVTDQMAGEVLSQGGGELAGNVVGDSVYSGVMNTAPEAITSTAAEAAIPEVGASLATSGTSAATTGLGSAATGTSVTAGTGAATTAASGLGSAATTGAASGLGSAATTAGTTAATTAATTAGTAAATTGAAAAGAGTGASAGASAGSWAGPAGMVGGAVIGMALSELF